ncbi:MAG: DUF2934 domain-containing protein [Thermodesulfovibrio sp.]|nr:DUF2934 domain-containing protein [Thermodesulfovibrio sp.]
MIDREKIEEEIRQVAYELYVKSGCIPGRDLDNWLEAEKIVLAKYNITYEEPTTEEAEPEEKTKGKRTTKKTSKSQNRTKKTKKS